MTTREQDDSSVVLPDKESTRSSSSSSRCAIIHEKKTIDLDTCTPLELVQYLQSYRFAAETPQQQQQSCVQFLQQALQVAATATSSSEPIHDPIQEMQDQLGPPLSSSALVVTCWTPRCGKIHLFFYERGIVALKNSNDQPFHAAVWIANLSNTEYLVMVPKPEDLKKQRLEPHKKNMLSYIILLQGIQLTWKQKNKTTQQQQLCFLLSDPNDLDTFQHYWEEQQQQQATVVPDNNPVLSHVPNTPQVIMVPIGNEEGAFSSFVDPDRTTTTGGLPFVSCYQGVKPGVLYPLPQGFVFVGTGSSLQFYPKSSFLDINQGRGSSLRYMDLQVTLQNPDSPDRADGRPPRNLVVEFTNIEGEEWTGLNRYIQNLLNFQGEENPSPANPKEPELTATGRPKRKAQREAGEIIRKQMFQGSQQNQQVQNAETSDDDDDEQEDPDYPGHGSTDEEDDDDDDQESNDVDHENDNSFNGEDEDHEDDFHASVAEYGSDDETDLEV